MITENLTVIMKQTESIESFTVRKSSFETTTIRKNWSRYIFLGRRLPEYIHDEQKLKIGVSWKFDHDKDVRPTVEVFKKLLINSCGLALSQTTGQYIFSTDSWGTQAKGTFL